MQCFLHYVQWKWKRLEVCSQTFHFEESLPAPAVGAAPCSPSGSPLASAPFLPQQHLLDPHSEHMEQRDDPAAAAARLCRSRSARCKTTAAAVQRWRRDMALRRRACDCTSCALDSRLSRSYDARFADARPSWPRYLACTRVAARPSCLLLAAAATLRSCSACERARRPRWHAAMTVALCSADASHSRCCCRCCPARDRPARPRYTAYR